MPDRQDDLLASRRAKLERLRQLGIEPYPPRLRRTCDAASAVARFEAVERGEAPETDAQGLSVAGRIVSIRGMGRAAFLDLRDASGVVQAMLRQNVLGPQFDLLKNLDVGDHLGVEGSMVRTRTGQVSIEARNLTLASKGMRPLPEKWHGLRDVEVRYRQRYLDLVSNPEVMSVFALRSRIIGAIRRFLDELGFLEVDTPILVPVAAGAHARPFTTHHNSLDQQLYLRIATELYLKRLIIGGFDRVYELGRVFRNEGIDQDHNPEFTLLESYQAYADYNDVMEMVESMVSSVAQEVLGTTQAPFGDSVVDFAPPWRRVSLREELAARSGIDVDAFPDHAALAKRAADAGLETGARDSRGRLIDKLISTFVEPHLVQPTFLVDYPEEMSPLAKAKPGVPGYVERFEAFAAGMEIANSYTELNDPSVQRERFQSQEDIRLLHKDEEVERKDEDFLLALEYGMPPTGGLGMGIDRLVMLLSSQPSIRDVVLFPQMRTLGNATERRTQSMTTESDSLRSSFREKLLEHVFVAELLQEAWLGESQTMEVLRPEVDDAGYDLVLNLGGVARYLQIKSSRSGAKTARQTVNLNLADKPGGCVIWLFFHAVNRRVELEYLVFPEKIRGNLDLDGFKVGSHTKGDSSGRKAQRPNTRVIPKGMFTKKRTTAELINWLFD